MENEQILRFFKIALGLLLLICLTGYFYIQYRNGSGIIFSRKITLTATDKISAIEEINKILDGDGLTKEKREDLLLQKALLLTIPRSWDSKRNFFEDLKEANTIYSMFYNSDNSLYKDLAIAGFLRVFINGRFDPYLITSLPNELTTVYEKYAKTLRGRDTDVFSIKELRDTKENSKEYLFPKSSSRLASMLSYNDIGKMVSENNRDDISLKSSRIIIKSYILRSFYRDEKFLDQFDPKLTESEKEILVTELQKEVNSLKDSWVTLVSSDTPSVLLGQMFAYAIGHDIYNSYSTRGLTKEINLEIDRVYDETLDKFLEEKTADQISVKNTDTMTSIWYTQSMHRRYGNSVDTKKINSLMKRIVGNINSYDELKTIYETIFKNVSDGTRWERVMLKFMIKALENSYMKSYMNSIGITSIQS